MKNHRTDKWEPHSLTASWATSHYTTTTVQHLNHWWCNFRSIIDKWFYRIICIIMLPIITYRNLQYIPFCSELHMIEKTPAKVGINLYIIMRVSKQKISLWRFWIQLRIANQCGCERRFLWFDFPYCFLLKNK